MRVLIGHDGSKHSDAAIDDLTRAGLPRDSEALIVSVTDLIMSAPEIAEMIGEIYPSNRFPNGIKNAFAYAERLTSEAEAAVSRAKERTESLFPEWNISTEVKSGTPASVLVHKAKSWNADLTVVGSQGHSAFKRFFLGSVSKSVVVDSINSVRIGRPNAKPSPAPRIIVAVDGSPAAEQAIYAVGQRAWPGETEVRLVAVDDSTPPTRIVHRLPQAAAMINDYLRSHESRVSAMLEWGTKELEAIGLKTSVVTKKGDAQKIILANAEEWNADSIFVGTRDFKNAFERFRLGSVSTAIVTNALCSVEVVRAFAEGEE